MAAFSLEEIFSESFPISQRAKVSPVPALTVRFLQRLRLPAGAHGCGTLSILPGKPNLWYYFIHDFVQKPSQGVDLNLHYKWFE